MGKIRNLRQTPKVILESLLPKADQIEHMILLAVTASGEHIFHSDDLPLKDLVWLERYMRLSIDEMILEAEE